MPEDACHWPNFLPAEIACRGIGKLLMNDAALDRLQALREALGKPLIVRSPIAARSTTGPLQREALEAHGG